MNVGEHLKQLIEKAICSTVSNPINLDRALSKLVHHRIITPEMADQVLGSCLKRKHASLRFSTTANVTNGLSDRAIQLFGKHHCEKYLAVPYKEDDSSIYFCIADPAKEEHVRVLWEQLGGFCPQNDPELKWQKKSLHFFVTHKLGVIQFIKDYKPRFVYS